MTPAALDAEYERIQENVRLHNQAVQAFAVHASAARPRARTAGIVETPQRTSLRNLVQSNSDTSNLAYDIHGFPPSEESNLADALQNLGLGEGAQLTYDGLDDADIQISRSLWIGSIPNSTTMSSLDAIFSRYGTIESTRVLTHKNCGFVNFESTEHAVRARQLLNGKEIFPGAGPVRIGYAKAPTASLSLTPVPNTTPPPTLNGPGDHSSIHQGRDSDSSPMASKSAQHLLNLPAAERLTELQSDILRIVLEFGGQESDIPSLSANIDQLYASRKGNSSCSRTEPDKDI
jgi:protein JSN1